ncbi:RING finger protein 214 isoform X2 [Conger conger]|nr:RING finger protein 214 isoform X2 [Conger conger]
MESHEQPYQWHIPNPWDSTPSFQLGPQSNFLPITMTPGDETFDSLLPSQGTESKQHWEQCVQTDPWTAESAMNTEDDWESLMRQIEERGTQLALQYEVLLKQQATDQMVHDSRVKILELQRDGGIRQQQALIDKMESLRVKLKLNCSKTTRKNFTLKKQELTKDKERLEEERNRLSLDLGESERRLTALIEEQCQEKLTWEHELAELQKEADRLCSEAEEANQSALRDEISALEMQREVIISQVEEWIAEAERYLQTLRLDTSQQHLQHRLDWDKNVNIGHTYMGNLQLQFNEQLQCLQNGQQRDSLPPVSLPPLPQVPTLELVLGPMTSPRPFMSQPPPVSMGMPFQQLHPTSTDTPARVTPEAVSSTLQCTMSSETLAKPNPTPQPPATSLAPASTSFNPAQPTGKLDKLLDKLGARFPTCSRGTLIFVLQQIKTSRSGTMAGLSMEELTLQVAQRLTQMDRQHLGPIRPPPGARIFPGSAHQLQRAPLPAQGPAVAQVFQTQPPQAAALSLKMCLVCQNQVETGSQHEVSCSHTVHEECISVWLQSTKNNSCPFCPSK